MLPPVSQRWTDLDINYVKSYTYAPVVSAHVELNFSAYENVVPGIVCRFSFGHVTFSFTVITHATKFKVALCQIENGTFIRVILYVIIGLPFQYFQKLILCVISLTRAVQRARLLSL